MCLNESKLQERLDVGCLGWNNNGALVGTGFRSYSIMETRLCLWNGTTAPWLQIIEKGQPFNLGSAEEAGINLAILQRAGRGLC